MCRGMETHEIEPEANIVTSKRVDVHCSTHAILGPPFSVLLYCLSCLLC